MKKITILALHLGYGGIEKAIASLSNMLCDTYELNIISTYKLYSTPVFFIDPRVKIKYLLEDKPNKSEIVASIKKLNLIKLLKEGFKSLKILFYRRKKMIDALKKNDSDIIISTRPFHNNLLGKFGNKKSKKIAWEHSHHDGNKRYVKSLLKSCKNIDYLITVSKELNNYYSEKINKNTKCLYISLSLDEMPSKVSSLLGKEITAIGRLSKEKGFLDLIDVYKLVHHKHPDWILNIVGDGSEKETIKLKIERYNLNKNVILHGYKNKKEINHILNKTSIYAMTSYKESFGLVIIEAMSHGIPCVAYDTAKGVLEIIENGQDGVIIEGRNIVKMADAINDLIDNSIKRKLMGNEARAKAANYLPSKIKEAWIEIIEK